jgi:hypothetical protein
VALLVVQAGFQLVQPLAGLQLTPRAMPQEIRDFAQFAQYPFDKRHHTASLTARQLTLACIDTGPIDSAPPDGSTWNVMQRSHQS